MEQVETKNQVEFTQEEKDVAARHKVEPKLVRLLMEIVEEHFAEPEPEEIETPEQPEEEQPAELCIDEQTQERLKSFFKNLEPRTKLAIATLNEMQFLDGINFQARKPHEEKLVTAIWSDLESACLETFHKEPDDVAEIAFGTMTSEDVWLAGVWEAVRMVSQNC